MYYFFSYFLSVFRGVFYLDFFKTVDYLLMNILYVSFQLLNVCLTG